jgi:hypothetical protein
MYNPLTAALLQSINVPAKAPIPPDKSTRNEWREAHELLFVDEERNTLRLLPSEQHYRKEYKKEWAVASPFEGKGDVLKDDFGMAAWKLNANRPYDVTLIRDEKKRLIGTYDKYTDSYRVNLDKPMTIRLRNEGLEIVDAHEMESLKDSKPEKRRTIPYSNFKEKFIINSHSRGVKVEVLHKDPNQIVDLEFRSGGPVAVDFDVRAASVNVTLVQDRSLQKKQHTVFLPSAMVEKVEVDDAWPEGGNLRKVTLNEPPAGGKAPTISVHTLKRAEQEDGEHYATTFTVRDYVRALYTETPSANVYMVKDGNPADLSERFKEGLEKDALKVREGADKIREYYALVDESKKNPKPLADTLQAAPLAPMPRRVLER